VTSNDDGAAVAALVRAALAQRSIAFEGTHLLTVWTGSGSFSRILDVRQDGTGRSDTPVDAGDRPGPAHVGRPAGDAYGALAVLAVSYRLDVAGAAVTLGRRVTVVVAHRGEGVVARWWLDDATGLALREELLDGRGRIRRLAAYLDFTPHGRIPPAGSGPQIAPDIDTVGVPRPAGGAREYPQRLTRAASGDLVLVGVRSLPGAPQTVHLSYSDGLSAVSVFLQPGRLDAAGLAGYQRDRWGGTAVHVAPGWPVRVTWQCPAGVVTVVAEDVADARSAVAALPGEPELARRGVLATVGDGLIGAVGWLVPG
jgi:sigma-E factor negative regulatory protein RseB